MARDATLYPRYADLMRVIVKATYRRFRRNNMRGLFEARLTRAQLLADLRSEHAYYGASCLGSPRSVSRWLDAMQGLGFFHRTVIDHRDALGRIRWKLMQFSLGPVGIQWIKRTMPDALLGLARSMLPKLAARFEITKSKSKTSEAVDSFYPQNEGSSPPLTRGKPTTPKGVALRIRLRSTASGRARRAPGKALVRGGSRTRHDRAGRKQRSATGRPAKRPAKRAARPVARRRGQKR